jgi:hypothetical protein
MSGSNPTVIYRIELRCLACGRAIGMLEAARWPAVGPCWFQAADGSPAMPISDWARLRCAVCGGNVYEDGIQILRTYPPLSWEEDESHRRGRPPKWLVAQRRASGEAHDR